MLRIRHLHRPVLARPRFRGGKQGRIVAEGNVHLDRDFPLLDHLLRARMAR
jgi:hypothetical protein